MSLEGVVTRSTGSWYTIRTKNGEVIEARARGKLRLDDQNTTNPIAVGDRVVLSNMEGAYVIDQIQDRVNYLIRQSPRNKFSRHVVAANLDMVLILISIKKPRTSTGFIDRVLMTCEAYKIPAVIGINKMDTYGDKEQGKIHELNEIYASIDYPILHLSAMTGTGMNEAKNLISGKTILLTGHSGVGKSTFLNYLEPTLDISTQEVSKKYRKGRHTTTFAEMHQLSDGTNIIDTPGIKEFGLTGFEPSELSHYFKEFVPYIQKCKFNDCLHLDEPECAIVEALENGYLHPERVKNYWNILEDWKANYKHWENV